MAGGADFLVDLEAAPERRLVEGAEDAGEGPMLRRQRFLLGPDRAGGAEHPGGEQQGERQARRHGAGHHCFSIVWAGEAAMPPPSTGLPMLMGSGRGRSNSPSSGNRTRKWK